MLGVGGVPLPELVREHGSPAYVLDEVDFRTRARAFRDAFADYDVFYAGKAFLCTTVARWLAEDGLSLDVCSGGELAVAERAGFPMERVGFHGNNKTLGRARARRRARRRPGHRRLVRRDRAAGRRDRRARAGRHGVHGARHRRRRGAHPRIHRHRPRGPEVRLLHRRRRRARGRTPACSPRPACGCSACTPTSAARSSTPPASRSRPAGCWRCTPGSAPSSASSCRRWTSAAASASPTRPRTTRPSPRQLAHGDVGDRRARVPGARHQPRRGCRSSPVARSSARRCARSTRSARSRRSPSTAAPAAPTSRSTAG